MAPAHPLLDSGRALDLVTLAMAGTLAPPGLSAEAQAAIHAAGVADWDGAGRRLVHFLVNNLKRVPGGMSDRSSSALSP